CNCKGFSQRCYFDTELYQKTGQGAHCLDCTANRDGTNCERCKDNFYMQQEKCVPCNCDHLGTENLQCLANGKCECKAGVTGQKCDRCKENYYKFSNSGCRHCGCNAAGSINNQAKCDHQSGGCTCKLNVDGLKCDRCKKGFFNLDKDSLVGCIPCFCNSHSVNCKSATGFSEHQITSTFEKSSEGWEAENNIELSYDVLFQSISIRGDENGLVFFRAPGIYLGNQRSSYMQFIYFSLQSNGNNVTVILEGAGCAVTHYYSTQENSLSLENYEYSIRLHENQFNASKEDFMFVISNLTAIKIGGFFLRGRLVTLNYFKLDTAIRGITNKPAKWIEECECPTGYIGQYCEFCAPGYKRVKSETNKFGICQQCECNNHAFYCDSESGKCVCNDNTEGFHCERCMKGYYGNARNGTETDCKPCGCPNNGECTYSNNTINCVSCAKGYKGNDCDSCSDGYYGDPTGHFGQKSRKCQKCDCNANVDEEATGNCNTITGECLKCIRNTVGGKCERCLPGYYGDAISGNSSCRPCDCMPNGSVRDIDGNLMCDQATGSCICKTRVIGRRCDSCEDGYYNFAGERGCSPCNCDVTGSLNKTCDAKTGQCFCKPGIAGLRCDHCEAHKYGFSSDGCKMCVCDVIGAIDLQCNDFGQCTCSENARGLKCNFCKENKHDQKRGCIDCPQCYNLILEATNRFKKEFLLIQTNLKQLEIKPIFVKDTQFENEIWKVHKDIMMMLNHSRMSMSDEIYLMGEIRFIYERQEDMLTILNNTHSYLLDTHLYLRNVSVVHLMEVEDLLKSNNLEIEETLDVLNVNGRKALEDLQQYESLFNDHSQKMVLIANNANKIADEFLTQVETKDNFYKAQASLNKSEILLNSIGIFEICLNNTQFYFDRIHSNVKEHAEVLEKIDRQVSESENLLQINVNKYKTVGKLYDEICTLKDEAQYLVGYGDNIVDLAKTKFHTLNAFDTEFQDNKVHAKEAIVNSVSLMEENQGIQLQLKEVKEPLMVAQENVNAAIVKAQYAAGLAKKTSVNALYLDNQIELLRNNVSHIISRAELMSERVENTDIEFKRLALQVGNNITLIEEAKHKIITAQNDSQEATSKVNEILRDIDDILSELEHVSDFDEDELNRLDLQLKKLEYRIKDANLENILKQLQNEQRTRNELMDRYEKEIEYLTVKVENMKQIAGSLPDGCYKKYILEP
ncbi:PREDICTED: laminin subunit gamma-1-like, partial [Nicrophorus vespilloides]|uniref:Laminin subunit gamma-1-like n=1 Tax=Nicrophorus vespilloides TaxID=110193 RepID=A0ABM1MVL8_NICVS